MVFGLDLDVLGLHFGFERDVEPTQLERLGLIC